MSDTSSNDFNVAGKFPAWYNKGQVQALDRMIDFTYDDDRTSFVLEGPAGSGKTTIIKEFRRHCKSRSGFVVAAPTHKAVRVISNSVGCEGVTIQKLLGLRPNFNIDNFDPNRIQFDPFGKRSIELYNTIVVDESGMIPRKLKDYMIKDAKEHGVKIIFAGDPYQLPPVGESISSVFQVPSKDKAVLNEIMRQAKENPLADLLMDIRKGVISKNYNYINKLYNKRIIKEGKGYIHADGATFEAYTARAFNKETFQKNIDWCKLITYTNENVGIWNKYVRNSIFPEHHDTPIIIHDLFTCYNTIVDEFNNAKITNSEDYIVSDYHTFCNRHNIKGWMIKFQEVSSGRFTPYLFIVDHTDAENLDKFTAAILRLIDNATSPVNSPSSRSKYWKEYYEFKDENLLLTAIRNPTDPKKILVDKDLDYGYSLTSHKSQGSTYDHCFVNLHNILYGNNSKQILNNTDMINRLFYVAASRARETLTILF